MKLISIYLAIFLGSCLSLGVYADPLEPLVPPTSAVAPAPIAAAPIAATSPLPADLQNEAAACLSDLNQSGSTNAALQQILTSKDSSQAMSLLSNMESCRLFSAKAMIAFVLLSRQTQPIVRGGIENNSPLISSSGPAFPPELCHAICVNSCRASVGVLFSLVALGHACTPCATTNPCSPVSVL